jgi:hypothetical protein
MMAFILAGIVAAATLIYAILLGLVSGTNPDIREARIALCIGLPVAALIAASQWLPHTGW